MSKVISLVGERFGRLVVNSEAGRSKSGNVLWRCDCDCGGEAVVNGARLRGGKTKSCGCISREKTIARNTTHGKRKTRLYRIWHGMKSRCYYEKNINYSNYGGRGITVCAEWKNSFEAFYEWAMANGYSDNLTIDRIDNNKGYSPDNCQWENRIAQANNKTKNTVIEINGICQTVAQWAVISGINASTISYRHNNLGIRGADLLLPPDPKQSQRGMKKKKKEEAE